jgi:hypothetical protein
MEIGRFLQNLYNYRMVWPAPTEILQDAYRVCAGEETVLPNEQKSSEYGVKFDVVITTDSEETSSSSTNTDQLNLQHMIYQYTRSCSSDKRNGVPQNTNDR